MMITNDKKFYNKVKMLKAFGIDKDINNRKKQGEYDVKGLGFNYRMTDFQAALGYNQIKLYKKNLIRRKQIAKRYIKNFQNIKTDKIYAIFRKMFIFCISDFLQE